MLRKDFILRQFEEFGKVLAQLLTFKLNKDWEKFEKEIAEASKKYTSLEIERVEGMSEELFSTEVLNKSALEFDQKKILATLLFEKMNFYLETGNSEKYAFTKLKCLGLYEHLANDLTQNEYDLEVNYRLNLLRK